MKNPLVSICIPTFNGAQFISEAIESAIAQTYSPLEIIVSDDASSDNTIKIIESYKNRTTIPICIFKHHPNGIGSNWNHCIKKANGKYIKFLFQDDLLMPNCVEEMVRVIEKDPVFKMVICKRNFVVEDSFKTEGYKDWMRLYINCQIGLELKEINGYQCLDNSIFKQAMFFKSPRNKVGEPTNLLFEKSIVNKIGYYREDLKQILDYEFCYRVLKFAKIPIVENELVKFRLHGNQTTIKNRGKEHEDYDIYNKIIFKDYYWLLSNKDKLYFTKKYYPIMGSLLEKGFKALRRK